MKRIVPLSILFVTAGLAACATTWHEVRRAWSDDTTTPTDGWLSWRGPTQHGVSLETGLVDTIEPDGDHHLWSYEPRGRGTPVIADGRVYAMGYEGEAADLEELIVCLDEATGELIWERRFSDFLSDTIYNRYAISSPTVDPETGNVFCMTTSGLLLAFSRDGDELWRRSLPAEFGRLTFPNGRTGAPVIDGERLIVHVISANWGPTSPARDRFYAFDKATAELIWQATPGTAPKDSSFSFPLLAARGERRVLYAGTGCGHVVCIDARTGDNIWRFRMATGGVNSSVVLFEDSLIAIHGKENMDSSTIGRMVSLKLGAEPETPEAGPVELDKSSENWRNDLVAFTSSPVLVGDRVYQTVLTGELYCIDARTGEKLWHEKLAPDQIHASPLAADGKLYVPMNNGSFYVIRPTDDGPEVLSKTQLEGNCLGAPAICNGRIYVHTTEKLYCFGSGEGEFKGLAASAEEPAAGDAVRLQVIPAEILARPGEVTPYRVRGLDAAGRVAFEVSSTDREGESRYAVDVSLPPVLSRTLNGHWMPTKPGSGAVKATSGDLSAASRIRIVPELPIIDGFDELDVKASPPPYWIGGGKKWEVLELDGEKVLAKTILVPLFQRSTSYLGHPEMFNYTFQLDIYTDGNRRSMSTAGVVNQRYLIQLKGNHQELEISSNVERIKESVPFKWKAKNWYTLKTRVDVAEDGSGVVRAKAWKRGDPEPEAWNLEVPHAHAHTEGAPGLFGFTPQSRFRVYVDNISVTPNE